jgi:hypothetical protein
MKLNLGSQDVFRDINAARYPNHPNEPVVRSVLVMEPEFDLQPVDIVGVMAAQLKSIRRAT